MLKDVDGVGWVKMIQMKTMQGRIKMLEAQKQRTNEIQSKKDAWGLGNTWLDSVITGTNDKEHIRFCTFFPVPGTG